MSTTIPGPEVMEITRSNDGRKFPYQKDARIQDGYLFPYLNPSFTIEPGQQVFTIGSCFARNIEEELDRQSISVPTRHYTTPPEEISATGRANKALNQFNVGTMLQCVRAIENGVTDGAYFMQVNGVIDALLSTGRFAVTPGRAAERREEIRALYAKEIPRSDVTIITLGLIESWYDNESRMYLNMAPTQRMIDVQPERYALVRLGHEDVLSMLREIVETIKGLGCEKIILTVSPVPLAATFMADDCITANSMSKATLRLAAGVVSEEYDMVDYFPSYEIVTSGGAIRGFAKDLRHPKPQIVSAIVDYMLETYMPNRPKQHIAAAASAD